MDHTDDRLPEMPMGLGLAEGDGLFVPLDAITSPMSHPWQNRDLRISLDPESGIPSAEYADGTLPPQLFSRWYGYVRAYPNCAIRNDLLPPQVPDPAI